MAWASLQDFLGCNLQDPGMLGELPVFGLPGSTQGWPNLSLLHLGLKWNLLQTQKFITTLIASGCELKEKERQLLNPERPEANKPVNGLTVDHQRANTAMRKSYPMMALSRTFKIKYQVLNIFFPLKNWVMRQTKIHRSLNWSKTSCFVESLIVHRLLDRFVYTKSSAAQFLYTHQEAGTVSTSQPSPCLGWPRCRETVSSEPWTWCSLYFSLFSQLQNKKG